MALDKDCVVCGGSFSAARVTAKYCSEQCKKKAQRGSIGASETTTQSLHNKQTVKVGLDSLRVSPPTVESLKKDMPEMDDDWVERINSRFAAKGLPLISNEPEVIHFIHTGIPELDGLTKEFDPEKIGGFPRKRITECFGPNRCLHPDTKIYDPVDKTTMSVKKRAEIGKPFHVFAKDGDSIVIAKANRPYKFKKEKMIELKSKDGTFTVTPGHRVWDGNSFVSVEQLLEGGAIRLPSISESCLSMLQKDAQSLRRRVLSSRDGYRKLSHLYGQQLLLDGGIVQSFAPSQAYAYEPYDPSYSKDDLESKQEYTHQHQQSHHPSKNHVESLEPHVDELERRGFLGISSRFFYSLSFLRRSVLEFYHFCNRLVSSLVSLDPTFSPSKKPLIKDYFEYTTFTARIASDETYYDFHVPVYNNYLAEGVIHHNSGKSSLVKIIAKNNPELKIVFFDAEGGMIAPPSNVMVIKENVVENIGPQIVELLDEGEVDLIVVDSVASLVTQKQFDNDPEGSAAMARALNPEIKRIVAHAIPRENGLPTKDKGTALLFINQLRSTVQAFGTREYTTGGNSLPYFASLRLEFRSAYADKVVKDGKVVGQNVRVTVKKSRFGPIDELIKYKMMYSDFSDFDAYYKRIVDELL